MSELSSSDLKGHLLSGGDISAWCVVRDEVLVACSSQINSYSLKTGSLLHVLDYKSSTITGIGLSPSNSHQLITTTASGAVIQWDLTDWRQMKEEKHGSNISHLMVSDKSVYIVLRETGPEGNIVSTIRGIDPVTLAPVDDKSMIIRKQCDNFTISKSGAHIIYTRHNMLRVLTTDSFATFTRFKSDIELVAAAIHSLGHIAAVGDVEGKITFLKDWNVKGSDLSETRHWHANAAGGLSFAPRSDALFSGGQEAVLVKWFEGEPQFLPRLGCSIRGVICSDKGDTVVAKLEDSTLVVINLNTWDVRCRIKNIIKSNVAVPGLLYDPVSRGVVFAARSGELQVFDPATRKHLKSLDITQQNKTTGQIANKSIVYTEITHFKLLDNWLVTVERRDDGYVTPECKLKFWRLEEASGLYELCTHVDTPHTKEILSLNLSVVGSCYTAITTSKDCTAKIWQCPVEGAAFEEIEEEEEDADIYKEWRMVHKLSHRNGVSQCAAVSADGTVVAVAYSYIVVLYNTRDWSTIDEVQCQVKHIAQVLISSYHLLIVSQDLITSFNMSSLSTSYEVQAEAQLIIPSGNNFIAFIARGDKSDAYVFSSTSSEPLIVHRAVCPGSVVGACCHEERIVLLNSQQLLYTLSVEAPAPLVTESSVAECESVFSELLKISSVVKVTKGADIVARKPCKDALEIVSTTSHALPAMSAICKQILSDLLPAK